jgi:hypothetical protein
VAIRWLVQAVRLTYTLQPSIVQVSDSFPFKWINKKWKEGFYVTSMATSHTRWAVVMSRNAGYIDQVGLAAAHLACWLPCLPSHTGIYSTGGAHLHSKSHQPALSMGSRSCCHHEVAGLPLQCVELDFQYASEGIHRRWDAGFRITACAATPDQVLPLAQLCSSCCKTDSPSLTLALLYDLPSGR